MYFIDSYFIHCYPPSKFAPDMLCLGAKSPAKNSKNLTFREIFAHLPYRVASSPSAKFCKRFFEKSTDMIAIVPESVLRLVAIMWWQLVSSWMLWGSRERGRISLVHTWRYQHDAIGRTPLGYDTVTLI